MQQAIVSEVPVTANDSIALPYAPSWLNRFRSWIAQLPVPAWAFYIGLWLALFVAYTCVKWLDGTYPAGTLFPFHAVLAGLLVYALAAGHYVSNVAGKAIGTFRPLLKGEDALYRDLLYRLTHIPRRGAWLAGLAGVAYSMTSVLFLIPGDFWRYRRMFASAGWSVVADYVMAAAMFAMVSVAIYQILHQSRLISLIYTRHSHISLFALGPLYEFSRVTARAALALILGVYAWFAADPSPLVATGNINYVVVVVVAGVIALVAFVQPLLGLHDLLVQEKQRLQEENGRQFEIAIAEMHNRVSTGELRDVEKLESVMNGLVAEREVLDKLRTWPWEPDTARVVITATLLPLVLWIIQRVLDRFAF